VVVALLLALCVGIVILVTSNTKESGGKNAGTQTEQSKDNADTIDDQDKTDTDDKASDKENTNNNESSGLEVVEPGIVIPENSSDASGEWGDTTESEALTGGTTTTVKPDETPSDDTQENLEIEEAKDDKIWSEVY